MASSIQITCYATHTDADGNRRFIGKASAREITALGDEIRSPGGDLAAAASATIWDNSVDTADFGVLWLEVTGTAQVELTTDQGAEVGTEQYLVTITEDAPFVLTNDGGQAAYVSPFAGTADSIEKVVIKNIGASTIRWSLLVVSAT